jgi:hypothetical protein
MHAGVALQALIRRRGWGGGRFGHRKRETKGVKDVDLGRFVLRCRDLATI